MTTSGVMLAFVLATVTSQAVPDFIGRWIRVETSGVTEGWDVADEVTIQSTEVADPAAPPYQRGLRVERRIAGKL